ncbi:hypothetical protein DPEC_G00306460 [Dallia pectoralis]|uniref:Uncharacterized protein n=1 Tax=Dallia pectoralis TaxID=75939 RepID=A0ACC2FE48_DALPE|nr:hypothetical protein DPEC_G00306460 [Dallia pectoralis]
MSLGVGSNKTLGEGRLTDTQIFTDASIHFPYSHSFHIQPEIHISHFTVDPRLCWHSNPAVALCMQQELGTSSAPTTPRTLTLVRFVSPQFDDLYRAVDLSPFPHPFLPHVLPPLHPRLVRSFCLAPHGGLMTDLAPSQMPRGRRCPPCGTGSRTHTSVLHRPGHFR